MEFRLENFEGPLDLLLHLIRKNELDICAIHLTEITSQYLSLIDQVQHLNLDVAGEFLVMAATLTHIKSRMLLPPAEDEASEEEEDGDPRAELVRRLLEYQKYKDAAGTLEQREQLGREFFARKFPSPDLQEPDAGELEAVGIYELAAAFQSLLKEAPAAYVHEVEMERLSVADRVNAVLDLLALRRTLGFMEIFTERPDRHELIVSFLAMLELVKMRRVKLMQDVRFGTIWLHALFFEEDGISRPDEASLGYH